MSVLFSLISQSKVDIVVCVKINMHHSLSLVEFYNLRIGGALVNRFVFSVSNETWEAQRNSFARFNVTYGCLVDRTQREVSRLYLPNVLRSEPYIDILLFIPQISRSVVNY